MTIGIFGRRGAGKSLIQTALGVILAKQTGTKLYSNYQVKDSLPITLKELFIIENGIILLDEWWQTMDSRLWKDKEQINITRWFQLQRKKQLIIFYTTQILSQLELRIRTSTDYFIYCQRGGKETPNFRYSIIDGYNEQIIKEWKTDGNKMKIFYDYYNTMDFKDTLQKNNKG